MARARLAQASPLPPHWLLGETNHFRKGTLRFVQQCMDADRELVHARVAFRDLFILLRPEQFQHVTQGNARNYRKSFAYKALGNFLGQGLLTNEGADWLRRRRMLQPKFSRQEMAALATLMQDAIDAWIGQHLGAGSTTLNFPSAMMSLSREVLTQSLFGQSAGQLPGIDGMEGILSTLRQDANARMKNPFHPPLWLPTPGNRRFHRDRAALKGIVHHIIAQRQAAGGQAGDLLGMLLAARDADTGAGLSPAELYDEVVTLFIAGQETTASALTFALYLLARDPDAAARVQAEARASDSFAGPMPYTLNVVQEALRLYPPAWAISREAIAADRIGDYTIPAGAVVFLPIYALHHDKSHWEAPGEFRPERWEAGQTHRHHYMPFGPGQRSCIGNHFALQEMQMVLASLLRDHTLAPTTESLDLMTPMTMTLRRPIQLTLQRASYVL